MMNKYSILITRHIINENYSLGKCYVKDEECNTLTYIACTLERGWLDNKSGVSCIPEGIYNMKLEHSPRFKKNLWEIYGVPGRSECKFHAANYWRQLNGCIALGAKHVDIDGDGDPDITSSRDTMKKFHTALQGQQFSQVEVKNLI